MFSNNAYAKVWEVQETTNQNGTTKKTLRVSTSKKKEDGTYETDFSGFVTLVGKAKEKAVADGDRIQFLSVGVTNNYDKEKKITYTNYTCFDFKTQAEINATRNDGGASSTSSASQTSAPSTSAPADVDAGGFMNIPDGIDEDLPFN